MKYYFILLALTLGSISSAQEFTELTGDYLGQTPPGDTPVMFAPGIISSDYAEHSAPAFSPDGNQVFWWVCMIPNKDGQGFYNKGQTAKRIGNKWALATDSICYGAVFISSDGTKLYCRGKYPDRKSDGPYMFEKEGDRWGEPQNLGLVSRFEILKRVSCPSVTEDGTLYFEGDIVGNGKIKDERLFRSRMVDGFYDEPEMLPAPINQPGTTSGTPFIAPDESYLIFSSRRRGDFGGGDLYICFRNAENDTWSEAINMGAKINTSTSERYPGLSPDGKYLFFTRFTHFAPPVYDNDVFWVSSKIIDELKKQRKGIQK